MATENEIALVVIHPFGNYVKGAIITDPAAIAAVRAADRSANVIQTVVPSPVPSSKGAN